MLIRPWLIKTSLCFFSIAAFSACNSGRQKTGYVDVFKLVSEFELQKDYSEQAKKAMDVEKTAIDSAVAAEKLINPANQDHLKNELYAAYYKKTQDMNKEIEAMIWKRLNPYLVDFGKEKEYLYIYGANGTGNVLYADKSQDITDEIIIYANNRYHDKK